MADRPKARPSIPDVLPLVRAVYARHAAGCCAHILLDDGNVKDASALFCLESARTRQHPDCIALCEALVSMTPTQRRKLHALPHA